MVPRSHDEWLRTIEAVPESDLPCNVSTVALAIQVATEYRHEAETWRTLFENATADA